MDEHRAHNLLLDVSSEVLHLFYNFLDLKSSVMLNTVCKQTNIPVSKKNNIYTPIQMKEIYAIHSLLTKYIDIGYELHNILSDTLSQDDLMANILRKLIFVSVVNNANAQIQSSLPIQQCQNEYNRLYQFFSEEMNMSWSEFNNILENAQFEFRGYTLINLDEGVRSHLNYFKNLIKNIYFNETFTVETDIRYGDYCMNIHISDTIISFDIHRHIEDNELQQFEFLSDHIKEWMKNTTHDWLSDMKTAGIEIKENTLSWPHNSELAPYLIAELITLLMPNPQYFKGGDEFRIGAWSKTIDENWVLSEVASEVINNQKYKEALNDVSFIIIDEFNNSRID
jgi:hypothetical protein